MSNEVAGYSISEAAEITVGAIMYQRPTSQQEIEEIISEMVAYGNERGVGVQFVRAMVAAEAEDSDEGFATYSKLNKALTKALRAAKKERGIK